MATTTRTAEHRVVDHALRALVNLGHRGATGADPDTGDGAGILLQVPDALLRRTWDARLPAAGAYGLGMAFLPRETAARERCEAIVADRAADEGLRLLGWRDVPVDASVPGTTARGAMPVIRQFAVASVGLEGNALERRLYVLRRAIERRAADAGHDRRSFHIASLSSRTVVYKGMLTALQLRAFYDDLRADDIASRLAIVHARFSTNVLPRWDLAQPSRMTAHNGEINTLRGNTAWMAARESKWRSALLGNDVGKLYSVLDGAGSDSTMFDNAVELLTIAGRPVAHAMMMMIPEAWSQNPLLDEQRRAFYEFHSAVIEPWDGPAAFAFTDGRIVGASLDRNGLRPARWLTTDDGLVAMASEAGALEVADERITRKWRLDPGRLLLVDTEAGAVLDDDATKTMLASRHPYGEWIREGTVHLDTLPHADAPPEPDAGTLRIRQHLFGWSDEDLRLVVGPMAQRGEEPVGSMGNDIPLAVLSDRPQVVFDYFRQQFAQVTNPPIDPIRESAVMSLVTSLGAGGNLLEQGPAQAKRLETPSPLLTAADLAVLRGVTQRQFPSATLAALFHRGSGGQGLREGLDRLCRLASHELATGNTVLILSDRAADAAHVPIPALLAVGAVHHHLLRERTRTGVGLVVETGEAREVAHVALLVGCGAEAVSPYLLLDSAAALGRNGELTDVDAATAQRNVLQALRKGLLKTIAKMGISTIESYCGSGLFEALGLDDEVMARCFDGIPSRIGGAGFERIAADAIARHRRAYPDSGAPAKLLEPGGRYHWRREGTRRAWNPEVIGALQHAVRSESETEFARYVELADAESRERRTLRGLLDVREADAPLPLEAVEPVDSLVRRFATGAMSLGSISPETHETLAIAMNSLGGRSNTGEGGEDPARFRRDGDVNRRSAIKQIASGRFGVTAHYLVNADEIQVKMAQGAKPGEGGQLPGDKVDVTIARLRHSTPGVQLISPPPHHDIYSVEDLAQLIHDLRAVNEDARISVKLVAEVGVGPVAAAVAKARADHIVIAGGEGGTGAAPLSSLSHAGIPWELGVAEAQQTLVANGLRERVVLQTDGLLRTGRDVVVAAMLGAEEFAFSTAPLVAAGCVMMRVCHLNTCPVGIATQDPVLRERYTGRAEHIVTFMRFLAEDVRRWMARVGVATFDDLVGRSDLLAQVDHSGGVDLSRMLAPAQSFDSGMGAAAAANSTASATLRSDGLVHHEAHVDIDARVLELATDAIESDAPLSLQVDVCTADRTVGARLSGVVVRRRGPEGLPSDTIRVSLRGSAGQSLGAWLAPGITLTVEGEVNDGCGKGLSGGRIVVVPPPRSRRVAEENVICGNVALYGATGGEMFVRGVAGERFAVRNSGARAVVEGAGDHALEYMTGGAVLIIGRTGRNLGAGMSGGVAYVLDTDGTLASRTNQGMVELLPLLERGDIDDAHALLARHLAYTGSTLAERLLDAWETTVSQLVMVLPSDEHRARMARTREVVA